MRWALLPSQSHRQRKGGLSLVQGDTASKPWTPDSDPESRTHGPENDPRNLVWAAGWYVEMGETREETLSLDCIWAWGDLRKTTEKKILKENSITWEKNLKKTGYMGNSPAVVRTLRSHYWGQHRWSSSFKKFQEGNFWHTVLKPGNYSPKKGSSWARVLNLRILEVWS